MKKYLLVLLLFSTISGIAQQLKGFPVTVVRYYDNDTIKLRSPLLVGYKETKISSFTNFSLRYYDEDEIVLMHPRRIKQLKMRDVDGNEITLVNPRFVNEILNDDQQLDYKVNYLFVEKYNGKVKWYRSYSVNEYSLETNIFNSFVLDGQIYWWNEFQRFKKIALRLYSDYPEIVEKLENQKKIKIYPYSEEKLLAFLIEYDQYIKD